VRRKILCLVNSAPYSRPYFEQLAPYLAERGFDVVFALDSHLSDVLYSDGRSLAGAWYFSDFVRRSDLPAKPEAVRDTWDLLLSDFDRFLTMDIRPPLRSDSLLQYKDVPSLLRRFFEVVFETEKPDAVLYEQVSNSFAIAAFRQSIAAGIPFCSICPSRVGGRIEISLTGAVEDHRTLRAVYLSAAEGSISEASYQIAGNYIRTIDAQSPDYMKGKAAGMALAHVSLRKKYLSIQKIRHFLRGWKYSRNHRQDCAVAFQHGDPVRLSVAFVRRALRRRLRLYKVSRYYESEPGSDPYVLYPLHSHPEASTSVLAPDFIDEMSVIRSLAFRLPAQLVLCVKEHPSAIASQPSAFYRQLAELPNVRLLSANLSAKQLIRGSVGVVCVTSTLGFEAAVLNKPVIALGDVLYGYYPNVRMVKEYAQLEEALHWMHSYKPVPATEILKATAAYIEFGDPGSFDFFESLGDASALASVADAVTGRLQRHFQGIETRKTA